MFAFKIILNHKKLASSAEHLSTVEEFWMLIAIKINDIKQLSIDTRNVFTF